MFARAWKIAGRITLGVGILLSFLVVMEILRAFFLLQELSPILAWIFASIVLACALFGLIYVWRAIARQPAALKPPPLPPINEATHKQMRRYCEHLIAYQMRLVRNRRIPEEVRRAMYEHVESMQSTIGHHPINDDFRHMIHKTEREVLPTALAPLRLVAEREIRNSVRDVMLGVTLSPYHSMDLLIVLYRNTAMATRIIGLYETRPSALSQLRILRDVTRVVATVNFLYIGRNLIENLFAFLPWVGRVADDIGQGIGAGLFTSAAGHAAIDRCTAYRSWDKDAAVDSLAAQTRDFLRDVKNIFTKDVLPDIKNRIISEAPADQAQQPGFWDNIQRGVNTAFDQSMKAVGTIIPRSARAATAASASLDIDDLDGPDDFVPPSGTAPHTTPPRERKSPRNRRGVKRVFHTFGQRIRYTFGLHNFNDYK